MSTSKTILLNFKGAGWLAQGTSRYSVIDDFPGVQKGTGEFLDLQGKPPQSTSIIHPDEWEAEQTRQKADLAERGIPDRAQTPKESEQKVEMVTGYAGGL